MGCCYAQSLVGVRPRQEAGEEEMCVKTVAGSLYRVMSDVCRSSGCAGGPVDELGYCEECRGRYRQRRRHAAELAAAACRRHWQWAAVLSDEQAVALGEHLAGNVQIGRPQIGWAVGDLLAETRETMRRAQAQAFITTAPRRRVRLRVIPGGL